MQRSFRTVGVIGKYGSPGLTGTLTSLLGYLGSYRLTVLVDEDSAGLLDSPNAETVTRDEIGHRAELVVVVGGDGTILDAARTLAPHGVPLLGVNLGRLGFLVDVSPDGMTGALDDILSGNYQFEERFLLDARVLRGGEEIAAGTALNDVVLTKRDVARMIEFDTFVDGRFISNHRADGIIIATPTGSTAYALSGGGPVLQPSLRAMTLVPICPHTLSDRPIVVDSASRIEVVLPQHNTNPAQITWDGQLSESLENGDRVVVERTDYHLKLIHPADYDYFGILRSKLHWGRGRMDET